MYIHRLRAPEGTCHTNVNGHDYHPAAPRYVIETGDAADVEALKRLGYKEIDKRTDTAPAPGKNGAFDPGIATEAEMIEFLSSRGVAPALLDWRAILEANCRKFMAADAVLDSGEKPPAVLSEPVVAEGTSTAAPGSRTAPPTLDGALDVANARWADLRDYCNAHNIEYKGNASRDQLAELVAAHQAKAGE